MAVIFMGLSPGPVLARRLRVQVSIKASGRSKVSADEVAVAVASERAYKALARGEHSLGPRCSWSSDAPHADA
jgi:hypothetical protein